MRYMVFIIYVITVVQLLNSKPSVKENGIRRGRNFYKISGEINIVVGMFGMLAVNLLLRDKNIIPQAFVWIALIGFIITTLYGFYCFYKMMVNCEP